MRTACRGFSLVRAALIAVLCFASSVPSTAQLPLQQLPQTQQQAVQPGAGIMPPGAQVYQPVRPGETPRAPRSRLEQIYSERAGRPLSQFGYDIFGVPTPVTTAQVGAIQQDYVLGVGDELVVVLRGQEEATYRQRVDRDGQIVLPRLAPMRAAGRTFDDFRADLEGRIAQAYIATDAFVSLGETRQISVLVTGEVRAPGTRILSALASPVDALLLSGGVAKTGSLRTVAIIRGNQTRTIDLYGLLTQGNLATLGSLQNGDRVFVPPLRNTVAVAGLVRRSGIYEIREPQIGTDELIQLAGGFEIAGNYRLSKLLLEPTGAMRLVPLAPGAAIANGEILFVDSTIDAAFERVRLQGAVQVPTAHPRATASSVARLVRGLEDLTPEAYTAFAILARRDPRLNTRTLMPFSLARVLSGAEDIPLQNDDVVHIFTTSEIRALANAAARGVAPLVREAIASELDRLADRASAGEPLDEALRRGALGRPTQNDVTVRGNTPLADRQAQIADRTDEAFVQGTPARDMAGELRDDTGGQEPVQELSVPNPRIEALRAQQAQAPSGGVGPTTSDRFAAPDLTIAQQLSIQEDAEEIGVTEQALVRSASDHVIWILDQVREPGPYLAAGGATLRDMVQIAGGVLQQADLSFVEVTSTEVNALAGTSRTARTGYRGNVDDFERVALRRLDVVRLRSIFSDRDQGQITVAGQVRYPGTFDITRSERLSSLLERAGGLTDEAYPYGAVFTRRAAARAELEANLRYVRQTETQAAAVTTTTNQSSATVAYLQGLAEQLRLTPALGRIVVTADPAILRTRPELDVLLEPGDTLYIPKRPSTVTVSGEVLNSGSFQYEGGFTIWDYVARAGGVTEGADRGRIFVVLPDGSARPVRQHWLAFDNVTTIPPGSTVIVPRDLTPFNLGAFLREAIQITSQVALTAASIAVIGR